MLATHAMTIIRHLQTPGGNFGDDLNLLLWDRLFPDLARLDGQIRLYGVGSLLGGKQDSGVRRVVLGAGLGHPHAAKPDRNWDFRWVRGPFTARAFGLPPALALGDSTTLLPELHPGHESGSSVGFIPHCATWDSFDWDRVASCCGMLAINPHGTPGEVIARMRNCSKILTESLHGAVFADAMAIPWAACVLAHRFNEFKWRDWLATIGRAYEPLVADRPLARAISLHKSWRNRLARAVRYRDDTQYVFLRPVAAATAFDVDRFCASLARYADDDSHFGCSDPACVSAQKQRMVRRCRQFAEEFDLQFNLAWP
jgi:hypothetical protein